MTPIPVTRRLALLASISGLLTLSGCASLVSAPGAGSVQGKPVVAAAAPQSDDEDRPELSTAPLPGNELTGELLFQFLMGEIAAQRGNGVVSSSIYLDLARKTRDPRIARRAAEVAIRGRQIDTALEGSRLWVELDPASAQARQILAGLLVSKNRLDELEPHLVKMLEADTGKIGDGLTRLNRVLGRLPDRVAVLRLVERVTAPYLALPEARLARAQAAFGAGDNDKALREADAALDARPDWDQAVMQKALILQASSPEKMLAWLEGYLRRYPDAQDVRLHYARALTNAKRFEPARQQFEKLLAGKSPKPDILYAVALLSIQLKDYGAAHEQMQRLLNMGFGDAAQIRLYLGQIAEEQKKPEQALTWYGQVESGEHYLQARLRGAQVLAKQGKLAEARAYLQSSDVADKRERFQLLQAEAQLLKEAGKADEAFDLLESRLKADPENPDLLYDSAMLAERLGKVDVMESRLRHLIHVKPDHAHGYNALGYSLADRGQRLDEARKMIKKALELSPDDAFIMDSMGWVLYRQGDLSGALAQLQRAHAMRPDPEIAAHLGEVLWMMGRKDEANKTWDEAVKGSPENEALVNAIRKFRH